MDATTYLIFDLKNGLNKAIVIYGDNQTSISMGQNPQFHGRAKQIRIKYQFIRKHVMNDIVELKCCVTKNMVADMLTKGLCRDIPSQSASK